MLLHFIPLGEFSRSGVETFCAKEGDENRRMEKARRNNLFM
jgi:hypothetical protein